MPETPHRYVDKENGRSTDYAKKIAEGTATACNELTGDVLRTLPNGPELSADEVYTVRKGDKGLLDIIKKQMSLKDTNNKVFAWTPKLLALSYANMFKEANGQEKGDINIIEPGDEIEIANGRLTVKMKGDKVINVSLFPNCKDASHTPTPAPAPENQETTPTRRPTTSEINKILGEDIHGREWYLAAKRNTDGTWIVKNGAEEIISEIDKDNDIFTKPGIKHGEYYHNRSLATKGLVYLQPAKGRIWANKDENWVTKEAPAEKSEGNEGAEETRNAIFQKFKFDWDSAFTEKITKENWKADTDANNNPFYYDRRDDAVYFKKDWSPIDIKVTKSVLNTTEITDKDKQDFEDALNAKWQEVTKK